jgi:hypothetical protein
MPHPSQVFLFHASSPTSVSVDYVTLPQLFMCNAPLLIRKDVQRLIPLRMYVRCLIPRTLACNSSEAGPQPSTLSTCFVWRPIDRRTETLAEQA